MSTSKLNVKFKDYDDHVLELIRSEAKAERYTGVRGLQEYMQIKYNAKLRAGKYGCTSVTFPDEFTCSEFLLRAGTK